MAALWGTTPTWAAESMKIYVSISIGFSLAVVVAKQLSASVDQLGRLPD
jgi:hypothetical protein